MTSHASRTQTKEIRGSCEEDLFSIITNLASSMAQENVEKEG